MANDDAAALRPPADPLDVLRHEHDVILQVLAALEQVVQVDGPLPQVLAEALPFCEDYADRRHHGKEEELLFPALAEWGLPVEMGPIGVMEQQHVEARSLLGQMRSVLRGAPRHAPNDAGRLADVIRRYVSLMREHIGIENEVLFTVARHTLPPAAIERLGRRFAQADAALGAAFESRCLARARTVCELAGVPFAASAGR